MLCLRGYLNFAKGTLLTMAKEQTLQLPSSDKETNLGSDEKTIFDANKQFFERLKKLFQSGHINFLIGSGASMPAVQGMGNIEQELSSIYDVIYSQETTAEEISNAKTQASQKESAFKATLKPAKDALLADTVPTEHFQSVLHSYETFFWHLEAILNDRKNSLLPKQANIFTTNYDLFFEKASESVASLVLNDGFDRTPKLNQQFEFNPKNFFNTVYHNGTVYGYKVELPTVNLVKLHGSCSWKTIEKGTKNEKIIFDTNDDFTIVLPRKQKFAETVINQTYYDLLRLYANELDKENALLLVFGFSFADEHILDITCRALKNPTLQIVIFSFSKGYKDSYQEKFKVYSNVEVVFFEANNINFEKLNELLACIPPVKAEPKVKMVFER
jgi:hypothetical protein